MLDQTVLSRADADGESPASAPADPERSLQQALRHHQAGRTTEAEHLYRIVIAATQGHAVASYSLGLLCHGQGRLQDALDAYRDAVAIQPGYVDALINQGTILLALGQPQQAVALYHQAIALDPASAMAYGNLGKALQDLGRSDEAVAAYREALDRQPDNAVVNANLGGALLERQDWQASAAASRRAITLSPHNPLAQANLGTALLNLGQHEEALSACRQAIALRPQNAMVLGSLGGAMLELGAWPEAEDLCRNAIALDPTLPTAWFNLSHTLKSLNRVEEAVATARRAIILDPGSAAYHFHLAHLLLLQGDFEHGWPEYDWRWKLPDFAWLTATHGEFRQPRWTGEDISDKTILIYTEQGLGDIVQFARYLPLVVQRARRVIVAAHASVRRILGSIQGITIVSIHQAPLPDFDVHCPLLSLPLAFATRVDSIPAPVPYLQPDPAEQSRWAKRIRGRKPRVGIVWAGNPATKRDRFRSPGFSSIAPLLAIPDIDFIVLQVGPGRSDLQGATLPPNITDLGAEVSDLADTAAIMSGLDLMISSCTGPLHLAGALGVPTWAMIPFAPYFPWLLDRTDSPWYPTVQLYRQQQPGQDWSPLVARIAADLIGWARTRPGRPAPSPEGFSLADGGFNEIAACRGGPLVFNRNDMYIGASLRKYGQFSAGESGLFDIFVRPGMTVLDIGANIGVHTVDLSRMVGPTGVVHAFEPQRLIFQTLCANLALNSRPNVYAHHAAVGAASGTLLVPALDPASHENYGGVSLPGVREGETVPQLTIDSLDLAACHIIKLDVEGMETEALLGARATIQRFRPILYVENDRQERSAELISLIQSQAYRLYWHLPPLYSPDNYRGDPQNIFGGVVSINMLCVPAEIPQSALSVLLEIASPADHWRQV